MKHIQKFADALLKLVSEGGPIHTLWLNSGSAEKLRDRSLAESFDLSVEGWADAWGILKSEHGFSVTFRPDPRPFNGLSLSAAARIVDPKNKNGYRLRIDLLVTDMNRMTNFIEVSVIRSGASMGDTEDIYRDSTKFKVEDLATNPQLPENYLRKFLEDFDKKGFGLKGITSKSVAASVIAASDPVYYTEVPAESVPLVVRFLEKSPGVKVTCRKKTDSGFVAVYFSIPANIKPSKIQTDLRLATSRRELEVLPDRSAKKPKATQKSPIPKMQFPGCKVTVPYRLASAVRGALKKMQKSIEMQGEEDASTKFSFAFHIDSKFDISAFEDQLREELNFSGFMSVSFFDLVEE